jgi:hypothetical protein
LHRPATVGSTLKMQIKPIRLANYPVHALRRLGNEQSLRHLALAFAVAGYSSFWLILAMWVLITHRLLALFRHFSAGPLAALTTKGSYEPK